MSETTATNIPQGADSAPAEGEETFNNADLKFFDSEDGHAGSVIGKMLTLFFCYTVVAMSLVAYWTYSVTVNSQ